MVIDNFWFGIGWLERGVEIIDICSNYEEYVDICKKMIALKLVKLKILWRFGSFRGVSLVNIKFLNSR